MRSAIAFDLDGTLVDSAPGILRGFKMVLKKHRLEGTVPLDHRLIGPPLRAALGKLTGIDDEQLLDALSVDFKQCYDGEACLQTRAFPGISEVLTELVAREFDLYLATNKRGVPTRLILDQLGWTSHFSAIHCLDEHADCGNKAEMLGKMLAGNELNAPGTPYIGDTDGDASSASANSMPYVHVAWGYGGAIATAPALTCTRPDQLVSMLDCPPWS